MSLRTFTEENFLFEIIFHFSPIKTFPFGLILMGLISVFQVNDPKFMNFFITSETLALAVRRLLHIFIFPVTYQKAEPLFYSRSLKVKSDT